MPAPRAAALLAPLLAVVLGTVLLGTAASADVVVVRSSTTRDAQPDVVLGAADADGLRRTEVELKRVHWTHLRVRGEDRLRVRAVVARVRPADDTYRQGLVVEAWRAPRRKPPRLIGYAVVFDRSSGVWATRASGGTARCPQARRTRQQSADALAVTLPAACLRLRGRVRLVATTYLDAAGPTGWGRAATDRSELSRALRYPRRLR